MEDIIVDMIMELIITITQMDRIIIMIMPTMMVNAQGKLLSRSLPSKIIMGMSIVMSITENLILAKVMISINIKSILIVMAKNAVIIMITKKMSIITIITRSIIIIATITKGIVMNTKIMLQ